MSRESAELSLNRRVGRRQLLAIGISSGAAAMLPRLAHAKPSAGGAGGGIGYVLGSDISTGLGSGPWGLGSVPVVVAPAGNVSPDASLAGANLDIMVHGLFPGLPETGVSTVALDAMFASFAKRERGPFPFSAWSFAEGHPARTSPRVAFKMPVGADGALTFARQVSDGAGSRSLGAVLTLDSRGAAKLRAGCYLLGLQGTEFARETTIDPLGEADWSLLSLVVSVRRGA
ncbi:MAG: hypothetical protein IH609_19790 [Dehalococcoidia bacterium]|nr:hypothetical protein [Dehalococcoidia bacterium]